MWWLRVCTVEFEEEIAVPKAFWLGICMCIQCVSKKFAKSKWILVPTHILLSYFFFTVHVRLERMNWHCASVWFRFSRETVRNGHRLGQNSTPGCLQYKSKFNADGRKQQRLEVVSGALCISQCVLSTPSESNPGCDNTGTGPVDGFIQITESILTQDRDSGYNSHNHCESD